MLLWSDSYHSWNQNIVLSAGEMKALNTSSSKSTLIKHSDRAQGQEGSCSSQCTEQTPDMVGLGTSLKYRNGLNHLLICVVYSQTAREVSSLFNHSDILNLDQFCVCWSQKSSCTTARRQGLELIRFEITFCRVHLKLCTCTTSLSIFSWWFCVLTSNHGNKHSATKYSNHNMMQSHGKKAKKSLLNLLIQKHLLIKFKMHNISACLRPN